MTLKSCTEQHNWHTVFIILAEESARKLMSEHTGGSLSLQHMSHTLSTLESLGMDFFVSSKLPLFALLYFSKLFEADHFALWTVLGPDPIKKKCSVNLCYTCFKEFDWLFNFFQPIRMLKTSVAQFYAENFLFWFGSRPIRKLVIEFRY